MSPRDWFDWFDAPPPKPPPEHGIRMKKTGTTWWGRRWIEALERSLGGSSGRLSRGRTYARAGRTHDLVVSGGTVSAKVTGSAPRPYTITIAVAQLSDGVWTAAIEGMAARAQYSAELLAGQMPDEIDEIFRAAGASLFPEKRADLKTACSCPDAANPCKHLAATHYVLGEAFDRDPFLLFELRGRPKAQVLEALRVARGSHEPKARTPTQEVPSVRVRAKAADYDVARGPVPALHFQFAGPVAHGSLLRQLGTPAGWDGEKSPAELFEPIVRAAAEAARRIAMAEVAEKNAEERS